MQARTPILNTPMPDAQRIANGEAVGMPEPAPRPGADAAALPHRWSGLAPHRLKRVLACIDLRLAEPIHVCELAEEVHMSPFHFTRMFKLATGGRTSVLELVGPALMLHGWFVLRSEEAAARKNA